MDQVLPQEVYDSPRYVDKWLVVDKHHLNLFPTPSPQSAVQCRLLAGHSRPSQPQGGPDPVSKPSEWPLQLCIAAPSSGMYKA